MSKNEGNNYGFSGSERVDTRIIAESRQYRWKLKWSEIWSDIDVTKAIIRSLAEVKTPKICFSHTTPRSSKSCPWVEESQKITKNEVELIRMKLKEFEEKQC